MRERILKVLRTSDLSDKEKEELILREIERKEKEPSFWNSRTTGAAILGATLAFLLCRKI